MLIDNDTYKQNQTPTSTPTLEKEKTQPKKQIIV
jgi:hypothetical protein